MTSLRIAVERYLSMRQGLGYKYQNQAGRLRDFVSFMERRKARTITTKLAIAWATLPPGRHALSAKRLSYDAVAMQPERWRGSAPRQRAIPTHWLQGIYRSILGDLAREYHRRAAR